MPSYVQDSTESEERAMRRAERQQALRFEKLAQGLQGFASNIQDMADRRAVAKDRERALALAEKNQERQDLMFEQAQNDRLLQRVAQGYTPEEAQGDLDAQLQAQERIRKQSLKKPTGQSIISKKFDQEAAKELADYDIGGGRETALKNINRFRRAIDELKAPDEVTGGLSTKIPFLKDDDMQDFINPKMASIRDEIRSAVQGSLKAILGAQYTEREGRDIFNRAFNPRMTDQENIKRAQTELDALEQMAANKDAALRHFKQYGTLAGFETPTRKDSSKEKVVKTTPPGFNIAPGPSDGTSPQMPFAPASAQAADPKTMEADAIRKELQRRGIK